MKRKLSVTFFAMLFILGNAHTQVIDSLLAMYDAKAPQEKIHIHFDNSLYTPGQTIWFKAYLLKGNEISEISKNFYIDWFDENGKLVDRTIAPIIGACASGNFTVPQKFSGNHLQVLAYTKWMLNFDSAFLFRKNITISQPLAQNAGDAVVPTTSLRFFPEGGDLIENIASQIAFKALNSAGIPMQVNGVIVDKNKQSITTFASGHDGMGKIRLTPLPAEVYTAEWKDPQGNIQNTLLPSAKNSGLVLSVNDEAVSRSFTIERAQVLEDRFKKVMIVATMNQQVVFRATANLTDKQKITANLPTASFPSGVVQLTVFDVNRQPVAERILFVNNSEYLVNAIVHTDTVNLDKRGRNVYSVEINDSSGTSLSLAVTDGDGAYDSSHNIISQLLLSSEIRGQVYNPAYYFSSDEDSVSRQLDLVMLTNGWRRFVWNDVLTGTTPKLIYEKDSGYLSIAGKIDKLSESKIKKAEMVNMILMAKDSTKQFVFTPLHPDGSFREDNLVLFDTTKIFYQLNKTFIPARSHVAINNTFLPYDAAKRTAPVNNFLPDTTGMARIKSIADEQKRLEVLMKQTTLKEVVVHAKIKSRLQEMNERYTSGLFSDGQSRDFNIADDPIAGTFLSAFAYLQGRVAGLQINNAYGGNATATWRRSTVSLFLDEVPVDATTLSDLPMSNVAYIKVFNPPFFGAPGGGAGGAIAVYTRRGDDTKTMSIGLDYTLLPGYSPVKEFYSPDYAKPKGDFSQGDLRRTLYWAPNIQTNAVNKKVKVSFYNNDISHTLQIVLEGITQDGRIIHVSKLLK